MATDRTEQPDERTQQPTELRLREARERGHVPRSAELTSAAGLLGGLLAVTLLGPGLLGDLTNMTATGLAAGRSSRTSSSPRPDPRWCGSAGCSPS